ncbi:MAG: hypothetical protein AB1469_01860 [Pseudomonadota bacterium]
MVEHLAKEEWTALIQKKTRKGSVYYADIFRGYRSLKRYGKHRTVNPAKALLDERTKNHINGIESFGAMPSISIQLPGRFQIPFSHVPLKRWNTALTIAPKVCLNSLMKHYFGYVPV